jgi:hypothetical protein
MNSFELRRKWLNWMMQMLMACYEAVIYGEFFNMLSQAKRLMFYSLFYFLCLTCRLSRKISASEASNQKQESFERNIRIFECLHQAHQGQAIAQ